MAIHPIDLQTLFTQIDKVGKSQVQEKAAQHASQEVARSEVQKQAETQAHAVRRLPDSEEGLEALKDKEKQAGEGDTSKKREDQKNEGERAGLPQIQDPNLGQNIDISG